MARSRVGLFEQIRRDWRAGGSSIRELAVRHHVHRRTVRQALGSAVPPPRKAYPQRPRPALDPYAQVIDEWLLADRDAAEAIVTLGLPVRSEPDGPGPYRSWCGRTDPRVLESEPDCHNPESRHLQGRGFLRQDKS
jgi:hypothetical protein